MNTINVNVEILEDKIQKLENLRTQCESVVVQSKPVQGSGKSINALNNVDKEYVVVKNKIYTLLSNSIVFFNNIKQSVIEADESAASKTD